MARPIEYTVSMGRAYSHYFDVTLSINLGRPLKGALRLTMPSWTPGHYAIDDFAKNVLEVQASAGTPDGSFEETRVQKATKNVWAVELPRETQSVRVTYSVYAFDYHDTKSYLDSSHAIINGAGVFIYPVDMADEPIALTLAPFPGWTKVSTGLEQVSGWGFVAPNIDVLIDSPLEVGNQEVRSFVVKGVQHEVSIFGDAPVDREKFVGDIGKIVEAETSIFGDVPYARYVFLVNLTDEVGGGLEHLNSTVCFVPRLRMIPREEYGLTMGLFSHEFFHAWNVKRMRPRGLGPFDYEKETFTRSLWIAEGITSYYDDLVLRRVGIYSVPEYLSAFAINIDQMKSLPGARWQSAQESSFDTWIKFYRSDSNSPNATMSYYTQGAVIGWMLDLQIRKNTAGKNCLDDVMRKVYKETAVSENRGYSDEEFEEAVIRVGGEEGLKEIFDNRVKGRGEVDFDKYLGFVGLKLQPKHRQDKDKGFLGVRLSDDGGRSIVRARLAGAPAEAVDLSVNDELIGADGFRFNREKLAFYISNKAPGSRINFLIARNGRLREVAVVLTGRPAFEFEIVPMKAGTEEQKHLFKGWLLEDWKPELTYSEYSRSPDRKSSLDYV